MLKDRLRTSAILITAVAALLYLDGNYSIAGAEGLWLLPLLMFFSLGTAWDITAMVRSSGRSCQRSSALLATAVVNFVSDNSNRLADVRCGLSGGLPGR